MSIEKRRILTQDEKEQLLQTNKNCYICQSTLEGYEPTEIQCMCSNQFGLFMLKNLRHFLF